jgi:hypothetical protein
MDENQKWGVARLSLVVAQSFSKSRRPPVKGHVARLLCGDESRSLSSGGVSRPFDGKLWQLVDIGHDLGHAQY